MTDIPEDVMDRSRDLYSSISKLHQWEVDDYEGVKVIASAIMAERERCATVAERQSRARLIPQNDMFGGAFERLANDVGRMAGENIAAAIRKGEA